MNIIIKIIKHIVKRLITNKMKIELIFKISKTKKYMTENITLKIFWKVIIFILRVIFFPIMLLLSLLEALVKTIIIWIVPKKTFENIYFSLRFAVVTWYNKNYSKENISFSVKIKRLKLLYAFIFKAREKKVSFGTLNPDITFYVIRPPYFMKKNELSKLNRHLLSQYFLCCQHLTYISNTDFVPIVDWENYGPFVHTDEECDYHKKNAWEYFWKQPTDYTLEEVYKSKNVILSSQNTMDGKYCIQSSFENKIPEIKKYHPYMFEIINNLTQFNDVTLDFINKNYNKIFPQNSRVIGVNVRGIAYGSQRYFRHVRQPSINEIIELVKEKLDEWEMEYIYFACELEAHVERMKEEFGEKVLYLNRMRYVEDHKPDEANPLYISGMRRQVNLEYLTEMVMLSKCNALISGISSGEKAAIIWNNHNYEHIKIISHGLWS